MKHTLIFLSLILLQGTIMGQIQQDRYLLQTEAEFKLCQLNELDVNYGTQIGQIITVFASQQDLQKLKSLSGVKRIEKAHLNSPLVKRMHADISTDSVYQAIQLETGYSGKDVLIGITDWGFNYSHPNFYDTGLVNNRVLAAWDQFKTSGPRPASFSYGTQYYGETEILDAEKDTFNIYGWATHGTHVAGIAGGGGAGIGLKGVAYDAQFLMLTFQANEAAVIDGIAWMKEIAERQNKRLVVNMSWGLYNLSNLCGQSLLSQALNEFSNQGVVLVTSAGNNGDVNFHIKKEFNTDTIRTEIEFYPFNAHPKMYGQRVSIWGKNTPFSMQLEFRDKSLNLLGTSIVVHSDELINENTEYWIHQTDTIEYRMIKQSVPGINNPENVHAIIKDQYNKFKINLKIWASSGTVHCFNVTELTNDVGNWGMPFKASLPGWVDGDNQYGLGEPASTPSVITVAAHSPKVVFNNGNVIHGSIANFSSLGPTIDHTKKPDISAPGVSVESSISPFTTRSYDQTNSVTFNGLDYPFARYSGTSMSSPVVTGVVALMLQANPYLSSTQIKQILKQSATLDDKTGNLRDSHSVHYGWGKVNAYQAVKLAEKATPQFPILYVDPTFELFPNPSKKDVFFLGEKDSIYNYQLFNSNGSHIKTGTIGRIQSVNTTLLSPGTYFMRIEGNEGIRKLIIVQ